MVLLDQHQEKTQESARTRVIYFEILMVFLAIKRVIMCLVIIGLAGLEHRMSRVSAGLRLRHTQTHTKSLIGTHNKH